MVAQAAPGGGGQGHQGERDGRGGRGTAVQGEGGQEGEAEYPADGDQQQRPPLVAPWHRGFGPGKQDEAQRGGPQQAGAGQWQWLECLQRQACEGHGGGEGGDRRQSREQGVSVRGCRHGIPSLETFSLSAGTPGNTDPENAKVMQYSWGFGGTVTVSGEGICMGREARRYEQVAEHIRDQVRRGVLRPGERLPSVRELGRRLGVSVSTVVEGYGLLQDERLIEPRPRSGFFVRAPARRPPAPSMSRPEAFPVPVTVSELALQVVQAGRSPGVIQMGTALPRTDFPAVGQLHRILARLARRPDPRMSDYDMPPGNAELRRQIARRAVEAGVAVDPDEVVVTNGCQEALVLALRAVTRAGDTVAIESPAFYGTLQAIESLGLKALEIPTDPRHGISLDALRLALEQWPLAAVILTPSFSNPLGYSMADARKGELVALLESAGVPLVEDDIYGDLNHAGTRPKAARAWDETGNVLLCSSLSKTLDPGLRIGWIMPGRFREAVVHLKLVSSMASPTLPAFAAGRYLESGGHDRHLRRARRAYRERRDRFLDLAQRLLPEGSRVTAPEGGFIAWVELPRGTDALALYHRAMQRGVSIAPGPLFSPSGRYERFVRLNFGQVDHEAMGRGLEVIRALLNEGC